MKIAFLGFGEAGQAFAASLGGAHAAHDPRAHELAGAAAALDVPLTGPEALAEVDVIVSAVTAAVSFDAVSAIKAYIRPGQRVIDINSVSPERKQRTAALVQGAGATYLDMAVMGPVLPQGHRTPVLVAGDLAGIEPWLKAAGFNYEVAGPEAGQATAIKMVRSLFVKGLEAITLASLSAANRMGCGDAVRASLAASYPGLGWPEFAYYQSERVSKHGARRAAEMRECAGTMRDLGLNEAEALALAIANVQAAFAGR
jgi:3-hydroxyisobutyrate dehydrogenase-like beta-hydroxyacid dehydrogenase